MTFTKQVAFTKKVTDLPNTPSPSYTPAEIKSYFQTPADELATTHNLLVDELESETGATSLGALDEDGVTPTTVQARLNKGTSNLTSHKEAVELDHPDQSVTTRKLKDKAVTSGKIGDSEVKTVNLENLSVTNDKLAGSITGNKITNKQIGREHIKSGAIGLDELDPLIVQQPEDTVGIQAKFQSLDEQLADITTMKTSEETAPLGIELIDGTGWTLGTGWAGDFVTGFTHAVGNTLPLTRTLTGTGFNFYQVEVTVSSPSSTMASNSGFTVSIGGSAPFEMYEGNYTNHTYVRGIQSLGGSDLVITPQTGFDGTITKVSVKEIIGTVSSTFEIENESGNSVLEIKPTKADNENVFVGKDNAIYNTTGKLNVGIGVRSLRLNTTGFWNVAVGDESLMSNTVGSRNVALGHIALKSNVGGHRNVAIGSFALTGNTEGHNNIALGADTMQRNTIGKYNIALGLSALAESVSGESNIAIGKAAMGLANGINNSVAIGDSALAALVSSPQSSIAIGHDALRNSTASPNVAIGDSAALSNSTGIDNLAIGLNALKNNATGERNIAIGNNAASGATGGSFKRNIVIGINSGLAMTTGADYNTIIGHSAATSMTTGNNNILIGYNVQTPAPADTFHLNIGNLIYGWMGSSKKQVGINVVNPLAHLHLPAGSTEAGSAPLKISAGTLMTVPENGAIEFDGVDLYFTTNTGVRKKITAA